MTPRPPHPRWPLGLLVAAVVGLCVALLALPAEGTRVAPAETRQGGTQQQAGAQPKGARQDGTAMADTVRDPVRIMPLGDSITGSPGCWRALLWQDLVSAGHTAIDFVGTLPAQGCGVEHDGDNEGHGGILATNMADQNQLPPWLSATNPDVVLMHLGTNDVWSGRSPDTILAAFTTLVEQMRAHNPRMRILVAQIIPMAPDSCPECGQRVVDLNAAIPAWAAGLGTEASPITVVDQWTGFDTATDTYDGVHPSDPGNRRMADAWFPPLAAVLDDVGTSAGVGASADAGGDANA